MTIRPTVSSSREVCERSPGGVIMAPPLKCFCFPSLCCSFTYSVILCPHSLLLNINVFYANGPTPAEVEQAPPLNVNPLPHLHTLKCQIPPQIIAAACARQGQCPPERQHRNNVVTPYAWHQIHIKACLDCQVTAGSRCVK